MDILVAGIPRSGTTMTLRLLDESADVFGWPGETAVLDFTRSLWSAGRPDRRCQDQIQRHADETFTGTLIDLQAYNAQKYDLPNTHIPTAREVAALSGEVVAAALGATSRTEALVEACAILRRFLSRFTDRPLIAEKTPSNLFSLPDLEDRKRPAWVLCHRDPFAAIASMRGRAGADPFAQDWGATLEASIGLYIRHAREIVRAVRGGGRALVVPYESAAMDPAGLLEEVSAHLGQKLQVRKSKVAGARKHDRQRWRRFSPLERWKILRLARPHAKDLGYDASYFGADEFEMTEGMPELSDFNATPLYGAFAQDEVRSFQWLSDRAAFALTVPENVSAMTTRFFNPPQMMLETQHIIISDGERRITSFDLPPGKAVAAYVDLARAKPAGMTASGRLYNIEISADQWRLPVASIPGNLDRRVLSCLMSPWTPKVNLTHLI